MAEYTGSDEGRLCRYRYALTSLENEITCLSTGYRVLVPTRGADEARARCFGLVLRIRFRLCSSMIYVHGVLRLNDYWILVGTSELNAAPLAGVETAHIRKRVQRQPISKLLSHTPALNQPSQGLGKKCRSMIGVSHR